MLTILISNIIGNDSIEDCHREVMKLLVDRGADWMIKMKEKIV
jgi:hypothetical protein